MFDAEETAAWIASAGLRQSTATTYQNLARSLRAAHRGADPDEASLRTWIMCAMAPNTRRSRRNFVATWARETGNEHLVPRVAVQGGNVRQGRWLSHDEARRLLAACDSVRDRALVTLLLLTGMRVSEVVSIRARDCAGDYIRLEGKGGKLAQIPLPGQAQRALSLWLSEYKVRGSNLVFAVGANHVGKILAARAQQAGIGHVACHDLRRTFCGWLDDGGRDLRDVQAAMRHSEPSTTQRYLNSSPQRAARAVVGLEI